MMQKCNIKEKRVQEVALPVEDNTNTISLNPALATDTPPSLQTKMSRLSYILAVHLSNSL
jgi:predicted secreted protein